MFVCLTWRGKFNNSNKAEAYLSHAPLGLAHLEGTVEQGFVGLGLLHPLEELVFPLRKQNKDFL